jgi:hypothetical protein
MDEFVQVLSVLFSLSDFGVAANPKAATPAEVTKYGLEEADVFLYVDFEPNLARNYRAFVALKDKPAVKQAPEIRAEVDRAVAMAEQSRAQMKSTIGIDPVTDLKSVAVWLQFSGGGEPTGVVAVRGAFPAAWMDSIAHLSSEPFEIEGQRAARLGDAVVARTRDGQVLIGTRALVEARLRKAWKAPAGKPGTSSAEVRAALSERPIATILFDPSPAARQQLASQAAGDPFPADLLAALDSVRMSLLHNGVTWRYVATDKSGYQAAVLASEGLLDLMRSSHLFGRGMARLILAGIRAHARSMKQLAPIVAREKDLLRLVNQLTGDGRFAASVNRNAARNTVTVRATGRKLSDVVPAAGILPLAAAGALVGFGMKREKAPVETSKAAAPAVAAPAPTPTGRPLDVRGVYQRSKKKRASGAP